MKTPGEYALDWANGKSWTDIVAEIRTEAIDNYIVEKRSNHKAAEDHR